VASYISGKDFCGTPDRPLKVSVLTLTRDDLVDFSHRFASAFDQGRVVVHQNGNLMSGKSLVPAEAAMALLDTPVDLTYYGIIPQNQMRARTNYLYGKEIGAYFSGPSRADPTQVKAVVQINAVNCAFLSRDGIHILERALSEQSEGLIFVANSLSSSLVGKLFSPFFESHWRHHGRKSWLAQLERSPQVKITIDSGLLSYANLCINRSLNPLNPVNWSFWRRYPKQALKKHQDFQKSGSADFVQNMLRVVTVQILDPKIAERPSVVAFMRQARPTRGSPPVWKTMTEAQP
jgi:hypothetical protein